jgi:thiamine biosynthesis lipoprotein
MTRGAECVVLALVLSMGASCNSSSSAQTSVAFGTICTIELFRDGGTSGAEIETLHKKLFERLDQLENIFSVNIDDSAISQVNRSAGIAPVSVPDELFFVLTRAVYFAELGAEADHGRRALFDPTIGPLVRLWRIGEEGDFRPPSVAEIEAARSLVDYRKLKLDSEARSAFLEDEGMSLDLGAIAKGYAADELVSIVKDAGVKSALIDLGGNIYVVGNKPASFPKRSRTWRIGIQNPQDYRGTYIAVAELSDSAVVSSGVYERNNEFEGKRYHHIISPLTGAPAESGLLQTTVIATGPATATAYNSASADALSTLCFLLGEERGTALIERLAPGGTGLYAVFVRTDGSVTMTRGAENIVSGTAR